MPFIPGLELNRSFYQDVVQPILATRFPGLSYAAARIGAGSDVLGFDTPMSTDHDWGPALTLLLRDEDAALAPEVAAALDSDLPEMFLGFPVLVPHGAQRPGEQAGAQHRVGTATLRAFVREYIDHELGAELLAADWLTISSQKLRELTAGAVYHDGPGELTALRSRLAWYPDDVWRYMLAAGWTRIGQEEHLMSRAGYVGDEIGAAVIGARLVRDVMQTCFLIERQYAPYPKWFGTAFAQLACAAELAPLLEAALQARRWPERASALGLCYEALLRLHNRLAIMPPVTAQLTSFFNRPFPVIFGGEIGRAIADTIAGVEVRRIAARRLIGSIDQWSDSTDLRADPSWRHRLRALYED